MEEREIRIPGSKTVVRRDPDGHWYTGGAGALRVIEARASKTDAAFKEALLLGAKEDPDCVIVHLLLADYCDQYGSVSEELFHLRNAVSAGDRVWQYVAGELGPEMRWWDMGATWPYMRAIKQLGVLQTFRGEWDEARSCFDRLLEMDPADHLNIEREMLNFRILFEADARLDPDPDGGHVGPPM
jgi:tetratricopeptide (TPR) repeat protein